MSADRRNRAYRLLLRLLPPRVREERGVELERLFEDMRTEWDEERGGTGAAFWLALAWDVAREAAVSWLSPTVGVERRTPISRLEDLMSAWLTDVRYGIRQLTRQPLYAAMVLLLMAVGIGGNTAVFRIFNGLFLKPLPFERSEQLIDLDVTAPSWNLEYVAMAYPDFLLWREHNQTFEAMALYRGGGSNLASDGTAERIRYMSGTHDLDDVLRLDPILGRFFTAEEDIPDGPKVALLSEGFWRERYGGDREVLGRTVSLNGQPYEIIGVMPPEARFLSSAEVWMPLGLSPDTQGWFLSGVGRLRDGVTLARAQEDLTAIHKGAIPEREVNEITTPRISPLRDRYLGDLRLGSEVLLGAVGLVLLIACSNIAGLMFARSLTRANELGIREALGASRLRIVRQLLTESVVVAVAGGALGGALGIWGSNALVRAIGDRFPAWITFDLDVTILGFLVVLVGGAAVVFGVAPSLRAPRGSLATQGRATATASRKRWMNGLVLGEVAMAVVLLVVGGLTSLDAWRLAHTEPGFATEGVASFRISLPSIRYPDDEARNAFTDEYLARLRAIPGVENATFTNALPLYDHWGVFISAEGETRAADEASPVVLDRRVTPGYFETMGVQLTQGRALTEFDGRDAETPAVIVNETFVRTHLGDTDDPVGRRVTFGTSVGEDPAWMTVVGVTRDVKHYGVDTEMRPGIYRSWRADPLGAFQVGLRYRGDLEAVVSSVRAATAELDPEIPPYEVESMEERMRASLWTRRATSWLIASFSLVALLLAVAGLYGVISYAVGQRRQEISIRMAMGAQGTQVRASVVRQGLLLVSAGLGLGLLAALASGRLVGGLLVGVQATEPTVYVAVTALLFAVASLANYLPARRAAALDPMRALRGE